MIRVKLNVLLPKGFNKNCTTSFQMCTTVTQILLAFLSSKAMINYVNGSNQICTMIYIGLCKSALSVRLERTSTVIDCTVTINLLNLHSTVLWLMAGCGNRSFKKEPHSEENSS